MIYKFPKRSMKMDSKHKNIHRLATHKHILKSTEKMSQNEFRFRPEREKSIVKKLECEIVTPNDSNDPSYTDLQIPYRVICRQRYQRAGAKQRRQFLNEIRKQEISQSKALSGVRIHRVFLDPVLTPPAPTEIIKLTPKQQFKLEQLLKE